MTNSPNQEGGSGPATAAAAIVPGPDWTLTFVLRNRGVHSGHWLLPRGDLAPEESAEQAARRHAARQAGVRTGALAPTGIYEVRGSDDGQPYQVRLHVYRALQQCPTGELGQDTTGESGVAELRQAHPHQVLPHPTDMRVLNDAGLADYDPDLVGRLLAADGAVLTRVDRDN